MVVKQLELHKPDVNYNPEQNTWNKGEKSSKTGTDKKRSISIFACFLTAIAKV